MAVSPHAQTFRPDWTLPGAPLRVSLTRLLWYLAVASIVVSSAVSLVRLVREDLLWVGNYNKVINPLLVVVAAGSLLKRRRIRVEPFIAVSVVLLVFGSVVGFIRGGAPRYFISHFFVTVFALALYAAARNATWSRAWLDRFVRRASGVVLASYAVTSAAFWGLVLVAKWPLYFGMSTGDLFLPFAVYLVRRRWGWAALSAFLILVSAKRGAYLGLFAIVFLFLPLPGRRNLAVRSLFVLACIAAVVLASFALEPVVLGANLDPTLKAVLDKWYLLNPFHEGFDLGQATGGRSAEISYAYGAFRGRPGSWLAGLGYGWSYFNAAVVRGSETSDFEAHYVHLSPMNYLLLYGLPLAVAFFWVLWRLVAGVYARIVAAFGRRSIEYALLAYLIGALVWSLTGYNLAIDPGIWLVLGALASVSAAARGERQVP